MEGSPKSSAVSSEPELGSTEPSASTSAKGAADIFQAEAIIGKKTVKGKLFYLVKWHGYAPKDSTWEPPGNLTKCGPFIRAFEAGERKKLENKRKGTFKSSRKKAKLSDNKSKKKKPAPDVEDSAESDSAEDQPNSPKYEAGEESEKGAKNSEDGVKVKLAEELNTAPDDSSKLSGSEKGETADKVIPLVEKLSEKTFDLTGPAAGPELSRSAASVGPSEKPIPSPAELPIENIQSQSTHAVAGESPQASTEASEGTSNASGLESLNAEHLNSYGVLIDTESVQKGANELKKYNAESLKVLGLVTSPESYATSVVLHCVKSPENWMKGYPLPSVKEVFPELLRTYFKLVTESHETEAADL